MTGSYVTHLESAIDGTRLPARTLQTVHRERPLWVRYDLEAVARAVGRDDLAGRPATMWRYRELLPVEREADIVSLGETMTPLVECPRLGARLGLRGRGRLIVKDESRLPTGSFKSRGMAVAVSMARALMAGQGGADGAPRLPALAVPTVGNAGGALAAYAARAGMECVVFMPEDTPVVNRVEAAMHGARVFLVDGLITDCAAIVREGSRRYGWLDLSTLREPYRLEGKKTMGLELADQMGWRLPDAIFYPTGGGTGLIGMWKAFAELGALGWLEVAERPRLYACQSSGCAPIVEAFERGARFAEAPVAARTIASGLRVPRAVGDFMILDAVRESGGAAMAADEARLVEWARLAASLEGIGMCPESAACVGAVERAVREGMVGPEETVVIFNTGAGQKYVEAMDRPLPRVNHRAVDWRMVSGA
jgi:threonine synthase